VTVLSAGADALVAAPALATSAATSTATSTPTSSPSPTADGSLRLVSSAPVQGDPLRFAWSTSTPAEHDWVAVYDDPAQGPTHQTHVGASTAWSYTPGEDGTVTIPSSALTAGHPITAYLLADDGYRWLAPPVTFTLAAPTSGPTNDGTLRLETTGAHVGDTVRFSFSTTSPDARNWIGIYADPSTMPADGQSHGASTTWTYVPATTTGTADLSTAGLPADTRIGAVLLYADGYQRLAPPITFTLTPAAPLVGTGAPTTAHFLQDDVVEPATRAGTAIHRTVAGAWRATDGGRPTVAPTFASTAGPDWLRVAPDGTVTGTAPSSSLLHPALLTVTATAPDGVTGSVVLEFPVTDPGTPPRVKAETLEARDGGTHVDDPVEKLARSVIADRVDLLALQDTSGDEARELATALGWDVETAPGGRAVLSAWPLQPRAGVSPRLQALSVTVDVAGTRVVVWDVDLPTSAVDPASVCTAGAARTVAAERDTETTRAAVAIAHRVRIDVRTGARVVLLGALRSPSHLDWTRADDTCGVGSVAWPVTTALAAAGLRDAYRTAEPSVAAHPGATTDVFDGRSVGATPSARGAGVPPSTGRQDAVLVAGRIAVTEAHTAVDGFPVAGSRANRWTSDHAAVAATLVLTEDSGAGTPATGGTGPARPGGATPVGGDDRHGAHPASDPRADPSGPLAFTGSTGLLGTALVALALLALGASALRRRRARPVTGSTDDPSDPTTRTTEQEGPR
jgi:hypothetical protein